MIDTNADADAVATALATMLEDWVAVTEDRTVTITITDENRKHAATRIGMPLNIMLAVTSLVQLLDPAEQDFVLLMVKSGAQIGVTDSTQKESREEFMARVEGPGWPEEVGT